MLLRTLVLLALVAMPSAAWCQSDIPRFVRITLESSEIVAGDTVVIEIEHTGLEEPLDLGPLDQIGRRIRETVGTRIAVISGKVIEIRLRRIQIEPFGTGTVIVGPFSAGDVVSNSATLSILEAAGPAWIPGPDDYRVSMTASESAPWIQQSFVLDIEFRHRHPIAETVFDLPDLSSVRHEEIANARRTVTENDGGWRVITWQYAIHPDRSGKFVIPPFSVHGTMIKSRLEKGAFEAATDELAINVKPSGTMDGAWWLPASSVGFSEEWSDDPRQLSAGDERIRTVTVTAEGVRGEQIPDIAMTETRGLLVTPLGVRRSTHYTGGTPTGTAAFDFRIRAMSPVPVFLDTIRLPWFDTGKAAMREAVLPARRIDIGIPDRDALLEAFGQKQSFLDRISGATGGRLQLILALLTVAVATGAALSLKGSLAVFARSGLEQVAAAKASLIFSLLVASGRRTEARRLADAAMQRFETGRRAMEICSVIDARLFGKDGDVSGRSFSNGVFSYRHFRPRHVATTRDPLPVL